MVGDHRGGGQHHRQHPPGPADGRYQCQAEERQGESLVAVNGVEDLVMRVGGIDRARRERDPRRAADQAEHNEEHCGEHGDVDDCRASVGLQENEHHGASCKRDRPERNAQAVNLLGPVGEEACERQRE